MVIEAVCLRRMNMKSIFARRVMFLMGLAVSLFGCGLYYGTIGGADRTVQAVVAEIMEPKVGLWYSHYGARRLDGYTIGRWKDIKDVLGAKLSLFPDFNPDDVSSLFLTGGSPPPSGEDYFVFYDDTVYGQGEDGSGAGNGGWGFGYMGLVRAVNTFHNTKDTGAIIIEYFKGGYPQWSQEVIKTPLPFFGIYYRVLKPDVIQMANAVVLENLFAGRLYHTETATLEEAIAKNNAENDGEFISWGVVIPQDRER
jgi:hypothetical protein